MKILSFLFGSYSFQTCMCKCCINDCLSTACQNVTKEKAIKKNFVLKFNRWQRFLNLLNIYIYFWSSLLQPTLSFEFFPIIGLVEANLVFIK